MKFIEILEKQNYIILSGIFIAAIAVLYLYTFHFATIAVSYVLGCVACYFGLGSNTVNGFLDKLKQRFSYNVKIEVEDTVKDCLACGVQGCPRHDDTLNLEPWVGLKVHKQLDQAIEDFYNAILDRFISTWYSQITLQPYFVDELKQQLRYASACLLRRAVKINYSRFITERLIPCALHHYTVCVQSLDGVSLLDSKLAIHPAAANRNAELKYLRAITNAIMPYLLKATDLQNSVFHILIREIFSGWVLLQLTDVLADPYILNTLIILATSDETMAQLPDNPNYKVEFLETFVRQIDSVYTGRCKLLQLELDTVLNDQEHFYAFMQYMKTTGNLHLLQFCKDIKSFQIRILNPELSSSEQESLFKEAWDLWVTYFDPESPSSVPIEDSLVEEMRMLLADGAPNVKKLQTSRALYQAARQAHITLERLMLPRFLHSEEYYKLTLGQRVPIGYYKKNNRPSHDKPKTGSHLRSALRSQTLDSRLSMLGVNSNSEINIDLMDNINLLKYLAQEEDLRERDLSTCKVVLTDVETRMSGRGAVRSFALAVASGGAEPALRALRRSEHDFHLLRHKLAEFHGDALVQHLPLPSRKDNSPLETIRYKYEDFLQRLLQMSLLHTSELLRIFLMEDTDFCTAVQAATLNANNSDLTNIYQNVTHRLRKEKGQHLESFMSVLLISSERDRWDQARRDVEIAQEIDEEFELLDNLKKHQRSVRDIHSSVFSNNFNMEPTIQRMAAIHQTCIVGFTQCLIYFLTKVVKVPSIITNIVGSICGLLRDIVDPLFNRWLNSTLQQVLTERRLAHFIKLGHGVIFGKKQGAAAEAAEAAEAARSRVERLASPRAARAVALLQQPHFNKQLVYNLLDLCLVELFPELLAETNEDR